MTKYIAYTKPVIKEAAMRTIATARKRLAARREMVPTLSYWIALNLFHRRFAAKVTQQELAAKAGISLRRLQSIETAATENVTVKTVEALAKALDIEVLDLFKPRKDYVRV